MMDELPEGWVNTVFGEIVKEIVGGGTPSKANSDYFSGKFPFMTVKDMKGRFPTDTIDHISKEAIADSATSVVPADTLIVATRMALGKVVRPTFQTAINQDLKALFLAEGIDKTYIEHWWRWKADHIENLGTGTTVKGIRLEDVRALEIDVPPLPEQRRIVAKVEELLAQVNAARDRLAKVPAILKHFRQSVLAAACSGRLTKEWRASKKGLDVGSDIVAQLEKMHEKAGGHRRGNAAPPTDEVHDLSIDELPVGWGLTNLRAAVCPDRPITYGILKPGPDTQNGIPYVRVADFPNDRLNLEGIRRTTKEIEKAFARARLHQWDILLSIRGTVGRVCCVPPELENANITQDTARLSIQSLLDTSYVLWFLRAAPTQKRMQKALKGVAVRGINIGDVRALQLPVPSLPEQTEIVRRIEGLFELVDAIETQLSAGRIQVTQLTRAILAKAFRGELVPTEAELARAEGRSFGSGEELLERIKATRSELDKRASNRGRIEKVKMRNRAR